MRPRIFMIKTFVGESARRAVVCIALLMLGLMISGDGVLWSEQIRRVVEDSQDDGMGDPKESITDSISTEETVKTKATRNTEAVEVFNCDFDGDWDKDLDGRPDDWTRRRGPEYPHYLKIQIDDVEAAKGDHSLLMELNGGAATIYSPPIEVGPEYSYMLEAKLKTQGLKKDHAYVTVTFYDGDRKPIETHRSPQFVDAPDWTDIKIGPITTPSKEAAFAVIGLHLRPIDDEQDIKGSARFDDIWLGHLPRMIVTTDHKPNVFTIDQDIVITCYVTGILQSDPTITFELIDISSHKVAGMESQLKGQIVDRKSSKVSNLPGLRRNPSTGFTGTTTWKPKLKSPGFYRVRVTMKGHSGLMQKRDVTFAVVRKARTPPNGEFGWTIPDGDDQLSLTELTVLLPHAAINWVKFPVWHGHRDKARANALLRFADRLSNVSIKTIGLLSEPPADVRSDFGAEQDLLVANIFSTNPTLWYNSLEPVLTGLGSKIDLWQLGLDQDSSFVGFDDVVTRVRDIKRQMEKFGQATDLAIGWTWMNEIPTQSNLPWKSLTFYSNPPLTDEELGNYMDSAAKSGVNRWVVVEPLEKDRYSLTTRATDLVRRMMVAKIKGAEGIFLPNPFSTKFGLMNDDGTPGELFLTWRTTSLALSGSKFLGSIRLPGGSENRIFSRGKDAVMVVWNDNPTKEVLYLGKNIKQIDLWGKEVSPKKEGHRQVVEVRKLPTFLVGVNEPIARMRIGFSLSRTRIPSVFRKPHDNAINLTNFFSQGVGGKIKINFPPLWKTPPLGMDFKLATGEELEQRFDLTLPNTASSGVQKLRIDFEVRADEQHKFSVYRDIEIGLGDVVINVSSVFDSEGTLIVKQEMINNTKSFVDFDCALLAPGRRRMRKQVFRLGNGSDVKTYRIPHAEDLIGKTLLLSAREMDGQRTLKYNILVEDR